MLEKAQFFSFLHHLSQILFIFNQKNKNVVVTRGIGELTEQGVWDLVSTVSFIHGGWPLFYLFSFFSHFIVSLFLCILRFDLYPCLYRPWFSPGFFHLSGSVVIPQRPFYRYRRPRTLFSVYHLHICLSFLDILTSPAHCSSVCTDTNRASRNVCYHSFDIYS